MWGPPLLALTAPSTANRKDMLVQTNWRACTRCYTLFFYGNPSAGYCPLGGPHNPYSLGPSEVSTSADYAINVLNDGPPPGEPGKPVGAATNGYQNNWRFCTGCFSLFYYGNDSVGPCVSGPTHLHTPLPLKTEMFSGNYTTGPSGDYELKIVSSGQSKGYQANWRFCSRCLCLFWGGIPNDAGTCGAGGSHTQSGSNYELFVQSTNPAASPPPVAPYGSQSDRLYANQQLTKNQALTAANNETTLMMQGDGNLVLYQKSDNNALWKSDTSGSPAVRAQMQYDGNFVLYDSDTNPVWATGTDGVGPNLHLIMQNDHNLVMYADEGGVLWASNTTEPPPPPSSPTQPKIRVSEAADKHSFVISGSGFLPNTTITVRITEPNTIHAPPLSTTSTPDGTIHFTTPDVCGNYTGPVSIAATDGRPDNADITGDLWSNTASTMCG